MKINKAIRSVMRLKKMSLSVMGNSLNKMDSKTGNVKIDPKTGKPQTLSGNDVSARLNYDNLSFDKAVEMLNVLGYEIVIQEKKQGGRRLDQIVIDQQDMDIDIDKLLREEAPRIENEPLSKGGKIRLL